MSKTNKTGEFLTKYKIFCHRYHWLISLVLYLIITVVLSYPLIFQINERILSTTIEGDASQYSWFLWWFKRAVESGQNPAYTNFLFGLLPSVQIFTQTLLNQILSIPLQWIFTPNGAYNILILGGFVLSGLTMYLLATNFVQNKLACFVAGFIFTFSTYHFLRAQGHLGLATIQWLPLLVWRSFIFFKTPNIKNALLVGVSIGLVGLTEIYYIPYFLLPFFFLFVLGKFIANRTWFFNLKHLGLGLLAAVVGVLLVLPTLLNTLTNDPEVKEAIRNDAINSTEQLGANLFAYFIPHNTNIFLGGLTNSFYTQLDYSGEKSIYLGYVAIFLAISGIIAKRNKNVAFWSILALTGFILSAGPKIYLGGNPILYSPFYNLVFNNPLLSSFRAPVRLGIIPLLACALLAAFGLEWILAKLSISRFGKEKWLGLALVILLLSVSLIEHILPIYSFVSTVPAVYTEIAQEKNNGLVLDLPYVYAAGAMYYQISHQKPLVAGYPSRITYSMINSLVNIPYIVPFLHPDLAVNPAVYGQEIYPYTQELKPALQELNIQYIILRQKEIVPANAAKLMEEFLENKLGKPFYNNPGEQIVAWKIEPGNNPSPNIYRFKLGKGWHQKNVSMENDKIVRLAEQDAQLLIEAPQPETKNLQVKLRAFFKPQTLEVRLNGQAIEKILINQLENQQEITLKTLHLKQGKNILELHSVEGCIQHYLFVPESLDPTCLSFAVQEFRFVD